MAQLAKRFEAAGEYGNFEEKENKFLQFSRMMKLTLSAYNQRMNSDVTALQPSERTEGLPEAIDMQMLEGYASLEDLFWQDFITEWDPSH
jgi:hypothetical protein